MWAWEIDKAILVSWMKRNVADDFYGEVPNCLVDPALAPQTILVYTNMIFVEGLSKGAWLFTVGHELGHILNNDSRYERKRDRYRESLADMRAVEICLQKGYNPLAGISELVQRFSDWSRDSFYADHPIMPSALNELQWRKQRVARALEAL